MIIDCHVHALADTPGHGKVSDKLYNRMSVRYVRWLLGVRGRGEPFEREAEKRLVEAINGATRLDAAAVFAFDAVHDNDGNRDDANTHLYVTNDYVAELARKHPKVLFVPSIHPYRKDAVAELERCVDLGAVMVKWLPIVQDFDPSDARCLPFYEALLHHKIPLLSHTGGEMALPNRNKSYAAPRLLEPALKKGVTVIMAHCGTRDNPFSPDYVPEFARFAKEYATCYGDTSMLNAPMRSYAYKTILHDEAVRKKLVHGSDWPLPPTPPLRVGLFRGLRLWREKNWLTRDIIIKDALGFDEAFWHRAGSLMRLPKPAAQPASPATI